MFALYDRVRVKARNVPGNIVDIHGRRGKKEPLYTIEIDDEYKSGNFPEDIIYCRENEIKSI